VLVLTSGANRLFHGYVSMVFLLVALQTRQKWSVASLWKLKVSLFQLRQKRLNFAWRRGGMGFLLVPFFGSPMFSVVDGQY
jgi:hypothetical protein